MAGAIVALANDLKAQAEIERLRQSAVLSGPQRRDWPIRDEIRLKLERHFMEDFSDVEIRALESAFDRNDYAAVAAWWESLGGRTSHWIGLRLIETKVSSWA